MQKRDGWRETRRQGHEDLASAKLWVQGERGSDSRSQKTGRMGVTSQSRMCNSLNHGSGR